MELQEYLDKWKAGLDHRKKFEAEWTKAEAKYDGEIFYQTANWQSKVSGPMVYEDVEKMVAKELRYLYKGRLFKIEPKIPEDTERIKIQDKLVEYQDYSVPRRKEKWESFLRYKYLIGTGIGKFFWDDTLGQPNYRVVSPWRFVFDPWCDGLDDCTFVMEEMLVGKEEVRKLFESGVYKNMTADSGDLESLLSGSSKLESKNQEEGASKDKVHVIEYHAPGMYAVILNKRAVVYEGPSSEDIGMMPYFVCPCIVRMETCWGRGIDDRIMDVADADDRLLNQQIDLARLLLNPPKFIGNRAGLESGHVEVMIGNEIFVGNINEIASMKFDGAADATKVARDVLNQQKEQSNGLSAYATGENSASMNDTAGGTMAMAERADERVGLYMDKAEDMLVRLGMMWVKMNEANYNKPDSASKEYAVKVKSRAGMTTAKFQGSEVTSQVDVCVEPPTRAVNSQAYAQLLMQMFGATKGIPSIDSNLLAQEMLIAANIRNVERFILTPEEQIKNAIDAARVQAGQQAGAQNALGVTMQGQVNQPAQMSNPNAVTNTPATPEGAPQ